MPELTAYAVYPNCDVQLVPAASNLPWMNNTLNRSVHRCLPIRLANQSGWLVLNNIPVRMMWNGENDIEAVRVEHAPCATAPDRVVVFPTEGEYADPEKPAPAADPAYSMRALSHFGSGIVTWQLPFLFRTSPGYNLLLRGPANQVKDGVVPLEGLIETDWSPAVFTMNWKITRPHVWITFDAGEPLGMVVPQRRGELEAFHPHLRSMQDADPETQYSCWAWWRARVAFNHSVGMRSPDTKPRWQMTYQNNDMPDGASCPDHQVELKLRPFHS